MKFLKKFMFRRATLVTLAILMQLAFLVWIVLEFQYFIYFYIFSLTISGIVVLGIINSENKYIYKIAWIIPILIFPIFGGIFYVFFGLNPLSRKMKKDLDMINLDTKKTLMKETDILNELPPQARIQSNYLYHNAFMPLYKNTDVEYLHNGEVTFKRLVEELEKAEKYIFLEYFIIKQGYMWNRILEILIRKAKAGVDCRVIYDDFGCLLNLPHNYHKYLEKYGIKCAIFNPIIPILAKRHNTRNHRKIAVIDGKVAFTGGINIGDEYINKYSRYGYWKDTAIMLKGEAVWSFTVMFLTMWCYITKTKEEYEQYKANPSYDKGEGYVQPFNDNPIDNENVGEIVYLNLINKATKSIYITTPYLIIDSEMLTALTSAAKAGLDVRIITPHIPDKWYVHIVTQSYYKILLKSGVKIYEYKPGFIHAKMMMVDDEYGVIGTINMDFRSLYLHFECGVWLYQTSCIKDMTRDFLDTLEKSEMITLDYFKGKWLKQLIAMVFRVFAPLL